MSRMKGSATACAHAHERPVTLLIAGISAQWLCHQLILPARMLKDAPVGSLVLMMEHHSEVCSRHQQNALSQYWDDAADGVREAEGTLLPLWRFTAERGRHKAVTALCWSSDYLDLFAAGYGSYGFLKQCSGLVACFSLKNPSYPEFSCTTDSGEQAYPTPLCFYLPVLSFFFFPSFLSSFHA